MWCKPAAVLASLRNRRRPDESGAAWVPRTFKSHRPVEPDVDRLVDDPHPPPAQLADDPIAGDPPPFLQPVPRPVRLADEALDQGQPFQRRDEVVAEVGIRLGERLRVGRPARRPGLEIRLDRLAEPLVEVSLDRLGRAVLGKPSRSMTAGSGRSKSGDVITARDLIRPLSLE